MTADLYGRKARLLFGTQISDSVGGFTLETDGASGLRIAFSVTRSTDRSANKAKIEIFNLKAETRGLMDGAGIKRAVLEAGYEDRTGALFCGDRAEVRHRREGTEWISTIEAGDGLRSLQSYVNGSYSAGVSASTILQDIKTQAETATGLTLASRISAGAAQALAARLYRKGLTFARGTRASSALQRVCADAKCRVSIQDCALEVLLTSEAVSDQAVALTPATGLIGTPERVTVRDKDGRVTGHHLRGQALLMADLAPGRLAKIVSQSESGTVLLTRVDHVGDTHGDGQAWVTRWEGSIR